MTTLGRPIAGVFLAWMLLACLSGCSTTGPVSEDPTEPITGNFGPGEPGTGDPTGLVGPERIGTLRTIGENVFHNQRQAGDGEDVYAGDTVSTGEASSAVIELDRGGFIQLDENTDPEFSFKVVSEGGRRCVHLYVKFGRVWVDSDVVCFDTPDGGVIINSVVNIEVTPGSTSVTVFRGNVLITAPREQPLGVGEQATIERGGIESVRRLSERELDAVARWRDRFTERLVEGWCCSGDGTVFLSAVGECSRASLYQDQREAEAHCRGNEGWCCDSGSRQVFLGTPDSCRRQGASFYQTEPEARNACRVEGWCCPRDGKLFFGTEENCRRAHGDLYFDQREAAEARCRRDQGWCCDSSSQKVSPGTPDSCRQQGAGFYQTEAEARKACTTREGWCCPQNGKLFFGTEADCRRAGGDLYDNQREAEARCRRDEGWCCDSSSSKVFPGTPDSCKRQGAGFYQTEPEARKACSVTNVEGWCCNRKGQVLFTTGVQCKEEGGTLYRTQEAAERACRR